MITYFLNLSAILLYPPVILDDVLEMDVGAAGDLVLQGKPHGTVVAIEEESGTMAPPFSKTLFLIEEAKYSGSKCQRKRWSATFHGSPNSESTDKTLVRTHSTTEIALVSSEQCPSDGYVHLNPTIDAEQGFEALLTLEEIRSEDGGFRFECADRTSSGLCASPENIRDELNKISPWLVSRKHGGLELVLGTPGQIVTAVRIDPAEPRLVQVERRIPAPF
jgi:hypothetical protein